MHFFELWGCEHLLAFEDFKIVGKVELFEEPQYALGAGLVEPEGGLAVMH